jgi:hypothetical protein
LQWLPTWPLSSELQEEEEEEPFDIAADTEDDTAVDVGRLPEEQTEDLTMFDEAVADTELAAVVELRKKVKQLHTAYYGC